MRFTLEQVTSVLRRRHLFEDVMAEARGGSLVEDGASLKSLLGSVTILEEYQRTVDDLRRENSERNA